jgi:hypothetical protein
MRLTIGMRWDASLPLAAWLMCNPSRATAAILDNTVRRVCHFSARRGMGGFVGVNVAPLRTPYPADLWPRLAAGELDAELWALNLQAIHRAADRCHVGFVAFGAEIPKRAPNLLRPALAAFSRPHFHHLCLGTNAEGWPLHPLSRGKLAVRNDAPMTRWEPPSL